MKSSGDGCYTGQSSKVNDNNNKDAVHINKHPGGGEGDYNDGGPGLRKNDFTASTKKTDLFSDEVAECADTPEAEDSACFKSTSSRLTSSSFLDRVQMQDDDDDPGTAANGFIISDEDAEIDGLYNFMFFKDSSNMVIII